MIVPTNCPICGTPKSAYLFMPTNYVRYKCGSILDTRPLSPKAHYLFAKFCPNSAAGAIELLGQRDSLLRVAILVAEHFSGTDAPLGEQARNAIAHATLSPEAYAEAQSAAGDVAEAVEEMGR